MPAPKRSTSRTTKTSTAAKPAAKRTSAAAKSGAKATATSARRAAGRTATQAKSGATKTANTARGAASNTKRAARSGGASATAKSARKAAAGTSRAARSGAKGTATAARGGAKQVGTTARASATRTRRASGGSESIASVPEQLAKGSIRPRDVLMLTRDRVQETLDEAAARGRVTRKDANDLVAELVRRGRSQGDELRSELDLLLERGRDQIGAATKRARKTEPVDRLVRGADRARRTVRVGPSFPILGYDELNASQVQSRLAELSKPELRKVLTYERNHAARKSVVVALEKAIG